MGSLLPRPAQVMVHFDTLRKESSQKATDWYYQFSQDSNYIRRDRIAKDMRWKTDTEYGELDISINLSSGLSGQTESPDRTGADQRCGLVSSVFPICLLQ